MDATKSTLLALFADLDPAADAVERLRALGLSDADLNVISGVPLNAAMLGRQKESTNVPRLALGGAAIGFLLASFLNFGIPWLFPIQVGGQSFYPGPPSFVVTFEITMLFMLLATFTGVFLDSYFPNYRPMQYVGAVSDGKIAVMFNCPAGDEKKFTDAMKSIGAQSVEPAEALQL